MPPLPILAASQEDIIAAGVAVVIIAGSWLVNAIKGWRQRSGGKGGLEPERAPEIAESPTPSGQSTPAEDLAARRREQLRELARQRAQAGGQAAQRPAAAGSAAQEPTNLTMAERIARARAKQQYAERSRQLQQPPTESQRREQPDVVRREAERRQRQMQAEQRRAEQLRARTNEANQRREAARRAAEQQRAIQRRPERPSQFPTPRPSETRRPSQVSEAPAPQVARLGNLTAAPPVDVPAAGVRRGGLVLNARSLRDAVILSEILGKPVSMRDPASEPTL